ncbi:MAG: hypothetical protein DRJ03_00440 [Chloroflexi bacterium]|nr:MAG: hypothetical protein DRJ03_00440 [Chloroflexota bacterium]
MDSAAIERLIARISWGYTPAAVSTQDDQLVSFLLRPPTPKEQAKAAMVYEAERQRAALVGLPPENEILESLISLGQWNVETDEEMAGLEKDIHTIRRGLLDFLFNRTKLEAARSLLRRAEKAFVSRLNQKHNLLQNSAEATAEVCQQRYLVGRITETEDGEPVWPTEKSFEDCNDNAMITQLCELFFHRSRISVSVIREVARSVQWRAYWEVAKATNELFDGPVASWSLNQRELAYWSTIYDSVHGAFERPAKDIIADDDLLDSWFIRQGEKIEGKTQAGMAPKSLKPGRNEEFIMADREGAQRVYNMNNPATRAQLKAKQKIIANKGVVREQDMPDSQGEMRQQLMERQRKHVKDISRK